MPYYSAFLEQVESAFEFARICRNLDYHNFVFSMKASNPVVMVQAYRLLVAEMYVQGWDYPLHLGVTEAGEGEDGRMKSAIGIGTLLQVWFNCIFNEMDDHFEFLYCFYVVMCSFSVKYELCYLGLLVICCSSNFNNVVGCGFQTRQLKFFHFDNSINFLNFSSKLNVIEISWHICMYGILHL